MKRVSGTQVSTTHPSKEELWMEELVLCNGRRCKRLPRKLSMEDDEHTRHKRKTKKIVSKEDVRSCRTCIKLAMAKKWGEEVE